MSSQYRGLHEGKSQYPSAWSKWGWSETYHREYRYRLASPDDYEYEYKDEDSHPSVHTPENREVQTWSTSAIAEYSASTTNQDDQGGLSDSDVIPAAGEYGRRLDVNGIACTEPSCSQRFQSSNDRDRHFRTVHSNNGERPYKCLRDGCPASVTSWTNPEKLRAHNNKWHGPYTCPTLGCSRGFPHGFGSQGGLEEHRMSEHYESPTFSQASTQAYELEPISESGSVNKGKAVSSDSITGPENTIDTITTDMAKTNLGSVSYPLNYGHSSRFIVPRVENTTTDLDPSYTVHPSFHFVFGTVFKVLWSEPTGSAGTDISDDETKSKSKFGEKAYHSIRRFIVVDERNSGHCLCLPILTYGGQGTLKKGVHASTHAVIYTTKKPVMAPGERITKKALRVTPNSPREKLHPRSRINYAKVYTVEHNVKICLVGHVAQKYEQQLVTDYNLTHRPLPDRPYSGDIFDEPFYHEVDRDEPSIPNRIADYSVPTFTS